MRFLRLLAPVVCAVALVAAAPEAGWRQRLAEAARIGRLRPFCRLVLDPVNKFTRVVPDETQTANSVMAAVNSATITVQYTGFSPQAQAAFQAAIDIWQTQVTSAVPILVTAEFKDLGSGSLLGQAGPTTSFANFSAGAAGNTWYPIPIVNKIALSDLNGATQEITAQFNSTRADWYFGTDGNTPLNMIDFESVVLHELGHGLGFLGAGSVSAGTGTVRASGGVVRYPFIYDSYTVDGLTRNLTDINVYPDNSATLASALTGNAGGVFWNGPAANAATPQRPRLYTPAAWQAGSSYSHLDETTYPAGNVNSLMTPSIGFHEAIHVPGPIMLGMYTDMGWGSTAQSCSYVLSSNTAGVTSPAGSGTVTVTANAGCTWTAVSNAAFVTITGGASGNGNGTVSYSYLANPNTSQRLATVTIAGQTFTLSQAGAPIAGCTYTLSPTSASASSAGGAATVGVAAGLGCVWSATSNNSFITVTSGATGGGNGSVGYTVAANTGSGQRTGSMTIASKTFTVTQAGTGTTPSGPAVSLDRTSLQFGATSSGSAFVQQTLTQTVRLSQTGSGTFTWTATPSNSWITVSPASGTGPATLTIGVQFASGLPISGTTNGSVSLSLSGASNTAGPVAVGLTTLPQGTGLAPSGLIETPSDGASGITGSIAVTGWAIDDVEVRTVRILRDPVAGEGPNLIFIGNAVLVEGSRPDVAAANPTRPRNTRGGWGYLLLTNFLPNGGNGTFRLYAFADDADGHSTNLGSKITCTNASAILPFGAIDTPGQGDIVSGAAFNNFGWVLSRGPALAYPPNGTVNVIIDGVIVGSPAGWSSRADLTALFTAATYPGVTNALGVYTFDTTALTNGVHTIAWVVTDNTSHADGVGSRFFTVANGAGLTLSPESGSGSTTIGGQELMPAVRVAGARASVTLPLRDEVNAAPQDRAAILGRRGFGLDTPFSTFEVGAGSRTVVVGEELDRFELQLAEVPEVVVAGARERYTGYLRVGGELAPLPIGSFLDPAGIFYWAPGVSFIGAYDLVFVRWSQGQAVARQELRLVLNVAGRNRVGPQVVVDTPSASETVTLPFNLAGWAIDPDAGVGTGIDTLHVWAYPADDYAHPIFLGAMAYGGERPDVAAIYGDRFLASGFGITVESLPAGTYDIAVFPWSTAVGGFAPAKVVRITVR